MAPLGKGERRSSVYSRMVLFRSLFALTLLTGLPVRAATVDYARDIQPILAEHCLACHGPDDSKGGLTLTTREQALKALKSGTHGIVPGKPDQSGLILRLTSSDPDEQMPPPEQRAKRAVTEQEMSLLRQWIVEGAVYDLHWAYKPVSKPTPPAAGHPVDAFVRTRLTEEGLSPSPEADRTTLIRRVYYDLLGLPPTPEQVDRFLDDTSLKAYETMVDQALASPHFGERWGRHWLDMARYADSDGYEKDRPRPDAWRYRDWVIRAINEDMPFDQFTIEQLAGDLLPKATPEQIVATAFNRQTLTNTEGGTDQEQFRVEACMDRTETLGSVWLGLTIGCARCHTHKYDQITHREYFQLYAYFDNGDEVVRQAPTTPEEWNRYERANGRAAQQLLPLQKAVDNARASLPLRMPSWEAEMQARLKRAREHQGEAIFEPIKITDVRSRAGSTFKHLPDGSVLAGGKQGKTDAYTVKLTVGNAPLYALKLEVLPDESLPGKGPGRSKSGNFVLSEVQVFVQGKSVLTHSPTADFEQKDYKALGVLDGKTATGWAVSGKLGQPHHLILQLAEPLPAGQEVIVELHQQYERGEHSIGRFRLLGSAVETESSLAPVAVIRMLDEEPRRRNPVLIPPFLEWVEKMDPEMQAAQTALKSAQDKLPQPPLMDVRVLAQRTASPRQTHIMHRGDFLQPTEPVIPATLDVLPKMKPVNEQGTRLDLARWLVSRDNPLTARVTVNHIWGKLFGEGLVETSADFGVRGERPSHPDLLDWLAAEFMDQGWSRKKLLKTLLMSSTYRQQSAINHESAFAKDPKNRLLWRQNRLRVEAEIVRDLHLAASGLMVAKVGGPSVFPPMPADVAALSYANNFKWADSSGADRYRRGMYTFFKRTSPYPDLTTFDCPDSNVANVKRTVSNTPLQALTTLNAGPFTEAAQALAARVLKESHPSDEARMERAFRLCVSRRPTDQEMTSLVVLLADGRYHYTSTPEEAAVAVGSHAAPETSLAESAAWTAVTRILLNLDEFITRE